MAKISALVKTTTTLLISSLLMATKLTLEQTKNWWVLLRKLRVFLAISVLWIISITHFAHGCTRRRCKWLTRSLTIIGQLSSIRELALSDSIFRLIGSNICLTTNTLGLLCSWATLQIFLLPKVTISLTVHRTTWLSVTQNPQQQPTSKSPT